jgi:uncharacterized protein (DUF305 family)
MHRKYSALVTVGLLLIGPAALQASQHDAAEAFKDSMDKMHQAMMVDYTGDADVDFVKSMIPHHQGAIDMANIELRYGKDPELRKMAEQIIAAQEKEIAEMEAWLKAHGS